MPRYDRWVRFWSVLAGVALAWTGAEARRPSATPLVASAPPRFIGFPGESPVLEVTLRNPSSREVTFPWNRLDPYVALTVTRSSGPRIPCGRAPRAHPTKAPAWYVHPGRDLVIAVDVLARCRF